MNKLLIVLLAVCLVSVQAFVKRDAPEEEKNENYLESLQKQFQDFSRDINTKVGEALDPEKIKAGMDTLNDYLKKALDQLKKSTRPDTPNLGEKE